MSEPMPGPTHRHFPLADEIRARRQHFSGIFEFFFPPLSLEANEK